MRIKFNLFPNYNKYYTMVLHKMLTVSGKRCSHCTPSRSQQYEDAIATLNSLQSNAAHLEKIRQNRQLCLNENVMKTEKYLNKLGVQVDDLSKLHVIHVSGTKGKGSTSAFCESLLRCHGYKTGFYSSPHLVAVRERIRLNGKMITEELFTSYFWQIYNVLHEQKDSDDDMPAYFKFLTVMAYYLFLKEKVDVAIIEVGIGGQYDCTNVISKPVVCGVTSLGLDHVNVLGSTIEKIAWQKSGIFKHNVPSFTVSQLPEAMQALRERANEIGCPLSVVPSLEKTVCKDSLLSLGFSSPTQYINAALALKLVQTWLERCEIGSRSPIFEIFKPSNLVSEKLSLDLNEDAVKGLKNTVWPGRCQTFRTGSLVYYLDGAHTVESIESCVEWFERVSKAEEKKLSGPVCRILVFNIFGDRKAETLLQKLVTCNFDTVVFCPNFAHVSMNAASDQNVVASSWESQFERCTQNSYTWMRLVDDFKENVQEKKSKGLRAPDTLVNAIVFHSICDVLKWLSHGRASADGIPGEIDVIPILKSDELTSAAEVHVLVTGSLHLVGGFLGILDPDLVLSSCESCSVGDAEKPKISQIQSEFITVPRSNRYSYTPGTP